MPEKVGFLEDDNGNPSSMRLMSVISLTASIAFALISLLHEETRNSANCLWITFSFLIAAFAPKSLQKFAESKFPPKNPIVQPPK